MLENIDDYSYLWDGAQSGWVLLVAPEMLGGFCIFNSLENTLLHIDDECFNQALCEKMREAGCEILDNFPSRPIGVASENL